jgi:hypothetical protein
MEIERKFNLLAFPNLPEMERLDQWQGYLVTSPQVRIRHTVNYTEQSESYILCIKSNGDLVRHEVETEITKEQFDELSGMLEYPLIHKELHAYQLDDGLVLECSCVDDGAFAYAEVEFSAEEQAMAWQIPQALINCLGREMTYEKEFKMTSYWSNRELAKAIR